MRQLVVGTFVTLDGVMQAPGGPEEDPTEGFTHGGWSAGYWDEAMGAWMGESMGKPFDLLLGRKTYEIFAAHWPHVTDPAAEALNSARKYVASRTLDGSSGRTALSSRATSRTLSGGSRARTGRRSRYTAART